MTPQHTNWKLLAAVLFARFWGFLLVLLITGIAVCLITTGLLSLSTWRLGAFAIVFGVTLVAIGWARFRRHESVFEIAGTLIPPALPVIILLSVTVPQLWTQPRLNVLSIHRMRTPLINVSALDRCASWDANAVRSPLSDDYYVATIKNIGPPLGSMTVSIELPAHTSIAALAVLNPKTFPQQVQCAQTSPPVSLTPTVWTLAGLNRDEERLIFVDPSRLVTGDGSMHVTIVQNGRAVIDLRRARINGARVPVAEAASAPASPYHLCTLRSVQNIAYAFLSRLYSTDSKLALLFDVAPFDVTEQVLSAIGRGTCQMYVLPYNAGLRAEHRGTVLTIAQMNYVYVMAVPKVLATDVASLSSSPYQVGWTGGLANDAVNALGRALDPQGQQRVCEIWHCAPNPSGPFGWFDYYALKYKWQVGAGVDVAILTDAAHGDGIEDFARAYPPFHFINIAGAIVRKMKGADIYFPAYLPTSCLGSASSKGLSKGLETAAVAVTAGRSNTLPEEVKKRLGAAFIAIVPNDCTLPKQVWEQLRADGMIAQ